MALLRRKLAIWFFRDLQIRVWRAPAGSAVARSAPTTTRAFNATRHRFGSSWTSFVAALRDLGDARAGRVSWPDDDRR
jgi:hypothetical protein